MGLKNVNFIGNEWEIEHAKKGVKELSKNVIYPEESKCLVGVIPNLDGYENVIGIKPARTDYIEDIKIPNKATNGLSYSDGSIFFSIKDHNYFITRDQKETLIKGI